MTNDASSNTTTEGMKKSTKKASARKQTPVAAAMRRTRETDAAKGEARERAVSKGEEMIVAPAKLAAKKKAPRKKAAAQEQRPRAGRLDGATLAEGARHNRRKAATKKKASAAAGKVERPSGLNLAAKVLAEAGEPLSAKQIAERAIAAGWKTEGKTPHATLYVAMSREIKVKDGESRFKKVDRGRFAARGKGVE